MSIPTAPEAPQARVDTSDSIDVLGVIPARYASSRFPGKAVTPIAGIPMVVRVARRAAQAALRDLVVATDDARVAAVCNSWSVPFIMTAAEHRTGTDRIAEVARRVPARLYINIQGDEPLINPHLIDRVVRALHEDPDAHMATAMVRIDDLRDLERNSVVKVVTDQRGMALYFSRAPIPYTRDPTDIAHRVACYRHVGIYAYRREALLRLNALRQSPLEKAESLEQLRALEHGMNIRVVETDDTGISVDFPEDVARVEALLKARQR